jgi:hypothetical protein
MFTSHLTTMGTRYTVVAASLVFAFVFSPAITLISGSFGLESVASTLAMSTTGLAIAWLGWKHSRLSILSIRMPLAPAHLVRSRS